MRDAIAKSVDWVYKERFFSSSITIEEILANPVQRMKFVELCKDALKVQEREILKALLSVRDSGRFVEVTKSEG